MNALRLGIFIGPIIAIVLAGVFYTHLTRKEANKSKARKFMILVALLGFLLNFAWEVIQMPLYAGTAYDKRHIAFCGLASIADSVMVLLLYLAFGLLYKNFYWIQKLTITRIFLLMLAGGIGAILAEIRHLSAGNWTYTESMPIIPIVNTGLSPGLQFVVLPVLVYYISFKFLKPGKN